MKNLGIIVIFAGSIVVGGFGCGPNQAILESAKATPTPGETVINERPSSESLESVVKAMQTAEFKFIYAFRRKDKKAMDSDDKRFLGGNMPVDANRRRLADENRAIIVGTNNKFAPEIMTLLTERFDLEDLSPPETEQPIANGNS